MLLICKQRLLNVYVLNHFLCEDIIELINEFSHPYEKNIEKKQRLLDDLLIERNKSYEKGDYSYEIMWNVKPSYSMITKITHINFSTI